MEEPQKTGLYLVPTPIGNLEDITLRGIRVLKEADLILAEDTRTSGKLLSHYEITTPMKSFHAHNEHKALDSIIRQLKEGAVFALVTDAGTPGISDPGFLLARECMQEGIKVECLPGATAFIPALVKSGIPSDKFVFEGFLPQKKGRQTRLKYIAEEDKTVVLYESPHRLIKLLNSILEECGEERVISVSRELTKRFEETINGSVKEVLDYFTEFPGKVKGEFVVIIQGKD
ncbi:16S rRNA (cytidine(1402)-2'-O)-methyltransferase [Marinigracilibium pacificum]|uniref:Ribosomal RNA small subunit methyltransferase I n=1 Tax=Marinigracilibium pacificum TaxID=2729599 RepID=A0A848IXU4_9BACT|nr:16S rRNA (cytidine(1402)-2'-O)-methyltransferase [Marinigracilibium pacificum]NMM46789.1 16S rRNA (cytidine(1402)-2'-O)-methyltransferase [Marinigracilibium pacificum]